MLRAYIGPFGKTRLAVLAAILGVMLVLPAGRWDVPEAKASSSFSFTDKERCFMKKINAKRKARGLRALNWDLQVGQVARRHARQISAERVLRHDSNYGQEITRWRRLGQNTGIGSTCRSLFRSFWRSDKHRSNILGRWRHMGVGVSKAGGRLYVQQVFESRRDPGNIY